MNFMSKPGKPNFMASWPWTIFFAVLAAAIGWVIGRWV
jgi:hypothetical protein